ncbi:hypothetical protein CR513_59364, partial [Mucuna pruriens]
MEPWRSRFSRTSRDTRSLMHDTPLQVHGFVLVFHVMSFWDASEALLKATRASKSGFLKP